MKLDEAGIRPSLDLQQLLVRPLLRDRAALDHHDLVGVAHCEAVDNKCVIFLFFSSFFPLSSDQKRKARAKAELAGCQRNGSMRTST